MKILLLLTVFATAFANTVLAQADHYCVCYHQDGRATTARLSLAPNGQITGTHWGEEGSGGPLFGYQAAVHPKDIAALIQKFGPRQGNFPVNQVRKVEIFQLVKNPQTNRGRSIISFLNGRGGVIYMAEDWGGRIEHCEGSYNGVASFCRTDSTSIR